MKCPVPPDAQKRHPMVMQMIIKGIKKKKGKEKKVSRYNALLPILSICNAAINMFEKRKKWRMKVIATSC